MGKKAKKPKKTAEEGARERLQARQLDDEIGESEQRFKALARNKLGSKSLLANSPVKSGQATESAAPKSNYLARPKKVKKVTSPYSEGGR